MMRVSIVMFMLPVFSTNNIPIPVKAAVTIVFSLGVWPHLALSGAAMPAHPFDMVLMLLGEVVLGLVLSAGRQFCSWASRRARRAAGFSEMGFTMINFADRSPATRPAPRLFFSGWSLCWLFWPWTGICGMIRALPPPCLPALWRPVSGESALQALHPWAQVFVLALKIAAPVMVALFMVEVAGLVARTSPQIHIMEFGFPIKIGVGFFFVGLLLVVMADHVEHFINGMGGLFTHLLRAMSPLYQ